MGPRTGRSQLMPFGTMVNVSNNEIADLPGEESSNLGDGRVPCVHINAKLACYGVAPGPELTRTYGENTIDRRKFLAAAGTVAAAATASQALAQTGEEPMHPPKYKALEEAASHCVATGNDCLRHCLGMYAMKDTSMAGRANAAYQLVVACGALQARSPRSTPRMWEPSPRALNRITVKACQTECEKFPNVAKCKACGNSCKDCAAECSRAA